MVEHRAVAPGVAGSSPVGLPILKTILKSFYLFLKENSIKSYLANTIINYFGIFF